MYSESGREAKSRIEINKRKAEQRIDRNKNVRRQLIRCSNNTYTIKWLNKIHH